MASITLHIQAVIFNNDFDALYRSCESIANAIEIARKAKKDISRVSFAYGDASLQPALNDERVQQLCDLFTSVGDLAYTFFNENTGFGEGHNRLASASNAKWLLIINPDIVVSPRFFLQMFDSVDGHTKPGIVEARQTPLEHPKDYDQNTGETSWSSGACMLINASLFRQLGGFDTKSFYMYCEDVDLSWRVRMAGYKVLYQPAAPAFHPKRLSPDAHWEPTDDEIKHSAFSNLMMAYKWSNDERLQALKDAYTANESGAYIDALEEFSRREAEGNLPERLDSQHEIATFIDGEYAHHRFWM